jgi:hypothetical protein
MAPRITGFLDFVHYPLLSMTFWKLGLVPFSAEWRMTPTLLGSLERVNLSHHTYRFCNPERYTSSEPFRMN